MDLFIDFFIFCVVCLILAFWAVALIILFDKMKKGEL